MNLLKTGDSRLGLKASPFLSGIFPGNPELFGPRSHQAHISAQDIVELRQLVDTIAP
jgi:hypothetical protein